MSFSYLHNIYDLGCLETEIIALDKRLQSLKKYQEELILNLKSKKICCRKHLKDGNNPLFHDKCCLMEHCSEECKKYIYCSERLS